MTTSTMTSSPWENPPFAPSPVLPELERKSLSRFQRLLLTAAILLGAIVFLVCAFCTIAAWIFAHPSVPVLASNPMQARGLMYEDVRFASADHASEVQGWWIPSSGDRTVVLSHGYGTNREEAWVPMYDIANLLHEQNYNVLMFDYGFADSSNRLPATGGVAESQQLLGALQFARDKGSGEVVVWGFSMGAGTALQAALQSDLIDGMILDSTFLPDADTIYANIRKYAKVPKSLTISLLSRFLPVFTGTQLNQIPSTAAQTTDYSFPILLIYGTNDDKSPMSISENIAASQTNPLSGLWVVPGALHEMIFRMHPEEYIARTTAFLQSIELRRA
ncbi:alpha/beta hydrolase [Cohnella sp. AR92]|uniref:alpha/beta hydrolase n=1 Tax=Cohnella sp. AR92 TaxID=648716 RepID=UPI000F8ED61A|nr:alpha/beta fold hydrolase [Cohnella sp. AR92]RUS46594.1 alpha/beta fold hydrolase [Cohnella sp. AR92]